MAKIINKVLTFEVRSYDLTTRKPSEVLATVKGWDELDAFYRTQGTVLIKGTHKIGDSEIAFWQNPPGWRTDIIGMENHYDDGTVEIM